MRKNYVHGSTAYEIPMPRAKPKNKTYERKRKKHRRNAARRNRARELYMDVRQVFFLTICVVAIAYFSLILIQTQSQIQRRMKHIAELEHQLENLKEDNDSRYKEIMTSIDYDEIKRIAIEELGMNYANKEQIIYYSIDKQNFFDQYGEIPTD